MMLPTTAPLVLGDDCVNAFLLSFLGRLVRIDNLSQLSYKVSIVHLIHPLFCSHILDEFLALPGNHFGLLWIIFCP